MKKGFTLVELIGVVIILALIALLAFPPILNSIRKTKIELSNASKEILYNAVDLYISENLNDFPKNNGNIYCVTLNTLVSKEYLPTKVYDSVTGEEISLDSKIEIKVENNGYAYNMNNDCTEYVYDPYYHDNSGANRPELLDNMVAIKYDGTNWIVADIMQKWYDYDKKEWANAVILEENITKNIGDIVYETEIALWYVWIPRFKYQLFNVSGEQASLPEIQIEFETDTSTTGTVSCSDKISGSGTNSEECINAVNGNWYTHPAFTFGDKELNGFWIGKFEVSTSDAVCNNNSNDFIEYCDEVLPVKIKPNVNSWRYSSTSNYFTSIKNIETIYSINNGNSHMIKNMEYGAVSYLTNSKYGRCNNGVCEQVQQQNNNFFTGQGEKYGYDGSDVNNLTGTGNNVTPTVTATGLWKNINGVWSFEDDESATNGNLIFTFTINKFGTISFDYTNEDLGAFDSCFSYSLSKDEYKYIGKRIRDNMICNGGEDGLPSNIPITKNISLNLYPGEYKLEFFLILAGGPSNRYVSNLVIKDGYDSIKNAEQGGKASTTGNIYGVYDMAGLGDEIVMANKVDSNGDFHANNSGFTDILDSKYYDSYSYSSSTSANLGKLGDATKEILGTGIGFSNLNNHWFYRGYSGNMFNFSSFSGFVSGGTTSRAILCSN